METAETNPRVLYLYGVIPKGQSYPSGEGVPLQAVVHSDLIALVEPVCAQEFSAETLDERLEDIEWVSRLARRHQTVLESAMRYGVVAPARLCTLFTSALALRLSLAAHEARFLGALEQMRGREEWGVKAFCDEDQIRARMSQDDARVQALEAALATATPGYAFILGKQRDARLAEIAATRIYDVSDEATEAVERRAVDLRLLRPLQSDEPPGPAGPAGPRDGIMVLNIAALVEVSGREAFQAAVAELAERYLPEGFCFELSGPWPPYNFCAHDDDPPADASETSGGEVWQSR